MMISNFLMPFLFFFIRSCAPQASTSGSLITDERRLIKRLLDTYTPTGKFCRPVIKSQSETLRVEFGINLVGIEGLDEKNQVLTSKVICKYRWLDQFLTWNEHDFGGIKEIRISTDQIWKPDFVLSNFADDRPPEFGNVLADVTSDGTVTWTPHTVFRSKCEIDTTNYPFDEQTCALKFKSLAYHYLNLLDPVFFEGKERLTFHDDYASYSQDWTISKNSAAKHLQDYERCSSNFTYPDLEFYLTLRRKTASATYCILILPCFFLSTVTLVLFMLPPESPAKMQLGVNILIAFFILLIVVREMIAAPLFPTIIAGKQSITMFGVYYGINLVMTIVSIFLCAIVVDVHFRSERRNPPPRWLKKMMVDVVARVVCIRASKCNELMVITGAEASSKPSASEPAQAISMEWRVISRILDRTFFYLYIVCMIGWLEFLLMPIFNNKTSTDDVDASKTITANLQ